MFRLKIFSVQPPYVRAIFDFAVAEQQGLLGGGPSTEAKDVKPIQSCPGPTPCDKLPRAKAIVMKSSKLETSFFGLVLKTCY